MDELSDNDYKLTEGAAWIETGDYAIRIYTDGEGRVFIDAYQNGQEYNKPIDGIILD